ncbi:MAG: energy-coupling factor ABC transporter ATP-binding protein [Thermoleophilia bacterium]|nr:energy-coupling factor ABC transporter ATP-binding protein [Thermoleophilia bacterium]
MSSLVSVSHLTFAYSLGGRPTLVDVSFSVQRGRPLLVLGPSGAGKSTLTLCLSGLIPQVIQGDYRGDVRVEGLSAAETPVHQLAKMVGLVFQDPDSQFCTLTVEDEIAFGLENLAWSPEDMETAIDDALAAVGLAGFRDRELATLSGGEKQRVALAAVLAMNPRVLLLDEPSAHLDPRSTAGLFALLRKLSGERRCTMVVIEHKLDELLDWVEDVLVLDSGGSRLAFGGAREVFYGNSSRLAQAGIWRPQTVEVVESLRSLGWDIPGNPLTVQETAAALAETPGVLKRLASSTTGSHTSGYPNRVQLPGATYCEAKLEDDASLLVKDIHFSYPRAQAASPTLANVSFAVRKGGFLAVAGPSGAGKTTLGLILSGILRPSRGIVRLGGQDLSLMKPAVAARKVGHVFQNPEHQFVSDTVFGELAVSLLPSAGNKASERLDQDQRALVLDWLERLSLSHRANDSPFALSHGQKRRLSVAAMLIRQPSLLVLDEPTLGQDEIQAQRLMALVQDFRARAGTVVMITHDMRLVAEYADVLVVLVGGRVLFFGSPRDFFADAGLVAETGMALPPLARVGKLLGERTGVDAKSLVSLADFMLRLGPAGKGC